MITTGEEKVLKKSVVDDPIWLLKLSGSAMNVSIFVDREI